MAEKPESLASPRWWPEGRDRKAQDILATLLLHCGDGLKDELWLDLGCGNGVIAKNMATRAKRIVGIDPDPWKEWSAVHEESPNIAFHKGTYADLERLLGRDSADVVICNQVYEHVDDPEALLHSIYQVLKPHGVCYFAGPNLLWPIEPHISWPFVHWIPRKRAHALMRIMGSKSIERFDAFSWSYWRLTRAFARAGFKHSLAIRERLIASFYAKNMRRSASVFAGTPKEIFLGLAWCAPGFVFVLSKPSAD
ncbi:class I SAM-dependent methyltransferase [Dyella humi]|uniref:Class I SAM-dependent methyltransferase n=1 Tax=Dyella humi TaxID=1770547 RepID=A0ABW8IDY5_9GAMM